MVEGAVDNVQAVADAQNLAEFETRNYKPVVRDIRYSDGQSHAEQGDAFLFTGIPVDLSEGRF